MAGRIRRLFIPPARADAAAEQQGAPTPSAPGWAA
jgi:hypothetical protein